MNALLTKYRFPMQNQYIYMCINTFICNVHSSCPVKTEDCIWKFVELYQWLLEALLY